MSKATHHESATTQIEGTARYVDDIPEVAGTLHAAPILSPIAHGKVIHINEVETLASTGVVGTVYSPDILGHKLLASFAHDEAIFADDTVHHVGQVMGLVVAQSHKQALVGAKKISTEINPLTAILDVREAYEKQHWVLPPVEVSRGHALESIAKAPRHLSGSLDVGGQEHFYLAKLLMPCPKKTGNG